MFTFANGPNLKNNNLTRLVTLAVFTFQLLKLQMRLTASIFSSPD